MADLDEDFESFARKLQSTLSRIETAESRLVSTLTRHSDAVSKTIIAEINNVKLSKQLHTATIARIESLKKQKAATEADIANIRSQIASTTGTSKTAKRKREELEKEEENLKKTVKDFTAAIQDTESELKYVKFQPLADGIMAVAGGMMSLAASVRETQQKFGIAADQAAKLQLSTLTQSFSSYIDALTGEGPAATMEQIATTQRAFQEQFGGVLDPEAAKRLTQEAIKMGITSEQMAEARRVFMTQTGGDLNRATTQADKFLKEFKRSGLTSKDAMQAISKYSELLARNGTRFQESFAKAAADAKKIGVDLNKVDQFADSIIGDFEGFLESQAELGAMGFQLDASRLAVLAESGDTGALEQELRSQLANTGKNIETLTRSQRLALEGMGLPMSDILKLAGKTTGSGEKTMEVLQGNTNSLLTKAVGFLEGMGKALSVIATAIAGTIAISSALTAFYTKAMATSAGAGGVGAGGVTPGSTSSTATSLTRGAKALSGAKVGAGVGVLTGLVSGVAEYQESGNIKKAFGRGLANLAGSIIGGALGSFIPIPYVGTMLGATAGSWAANWLFDKVFADDFVSKPGYGKRTLLTPTGAIALNNKDNIIAYADDLMGAKKLPLGTISKQFGGLDEFNVRVNQTFSNLADNITGKFQNVKQSIGNIFGSSSEGLLGKFQQLRQTGGGFVDNLKTSVTGKAQGLLSKFTGKDSLISKAKGLIGGEGLTSKLPGVGGLVSKFTGGGLKTLGTNLLGKVGLGSVAGSLAGGPFTMATSLAAPLLKKIPGIGPALGAIAEGPGKFIGSTIGKVGGFARRLFRGKSPTEAMTSIASGPVGGLASKVLGKRAGSVIGGLTSPLGKVAGLARLGGRLFGKKQTVTPTAMETEGGLDVSKFMGTSQQTQQTQPELKMPAIDTSGIEKQLNMFIQALSNIQVNMDGAKVGQLITNADQIAAAAGVFRAQR